MTVHDLPAIHRAAKFTRKVTRNSTSPAISAPARISLGSDGRFLWVTREAQLWWGAPVIARLLGWLAG